MSFWQYQMHQELSFQQTVLRNVNDKCAYLQKELDNAVREARSQISLLNNKIAEIERDLDLERKRTAAMHNSAKDREKEYQKLKAQYDKIKRKALLAPDRDAPESFKRGVEFQQNKPASASVDVGAVVGDMNANGIQRTPIGSRGTPQNTSWRPPTQIQIHHSGYRAGNGNISISDQSENELDEHAPRRAHRANNTVRAPTNAHAGPGRKHSFFPPSSNKSSAVFGRVV